MSRCVFLELAAGRRCNPQARTPALRLGTGFNVAGNAALHFTGLPHLEL
jgi:hypothetical protein